MMENQFYYWIFFSLICIDKFMNEYCSLGCYWFMYNLQYSFLNLQNLVLVHVRFASLSGHSWTFLIWQVFYELDEERNRSGANDVAICRLEQLCPVPYDLIFRELKRYPSTSLAFL